MGAGCRSERRKVGELRSLCQIISLHGPDESGLRGAFSLGLRAAVILATRSDVALAMRDFTSLSRVVKENILFPGAASRRFLPRPPHMIGLPGRG